MVKKKRPAGHAEAPEPSIRCAGDLARDTRCVDQDTLNNEIWKIFDKHPEIDCLAVTEKRQVLGLINREFFMTRMAGRFHWEIYGKKRCTKMMSESPLLIDAATPIVEIAGLLIEADTPNVLSDNFVVLRDGQLVGIGHTRDVMAFLLRHEQQVAETLRRSEEHLQRMVEERTQDLLQAKLSAEHANRAKSDFLANISHELRTPLHGVLAFSKLGLERRNSVGPDQLAQYFDKINQCANRLSLMVGDLIDMSSLDSGKARLSRIDADLGDLVTRAIAGLASFAAERQVAVHGDCRIGDARLSCEPPRVAQVLYHVIGNAIKFSPPGAAVQVQIRCKCTAGTPPESHPSALIVSVSDQGPGIPEGEQEHIFEHFVQSSATATGAGGKGLGLAISRQIMRLHGGAIRVRNNPEGGACFSLEFPVLPPETPPPTVAAP